MIFANSSSLLWSVRRARVVFIGSSTNLSLHVAILTTAHAQLTRGSIDFWARKSMSLGHADATSLRIEADPVSMHAHPFLA